MGIPVFPILKPTPTSLPIPSLWVILVSPKHPVSCIEPELVIRFLYDIIHVSMPFSQIIPPPTTESKKLFKRAISKAHFSGLLLLLFFFFSHEVV